MVNDTYSLEYYDALIIIPDQNKAKAEILTQNKHL